MKRAPLFDETHKHDVQSAALFLGRAAFGRLPMHTNSLNGGEGNRRDRPISDTVGGSRVGAESTAQATSARDHLELDHLTMHADLSFSGAADSASSSSSEWWARYDNGHDGAAANRRALMDAPVVGFGLGEDRDASSSWLATTALCPYAPALNVDLYFEPGVVNQGGKMGMGVGCGQEDDGTDGDRGVDEPHRSAALMDRLNADVDMWEDCCAPALASAHRAALMARPVLHVISPMPYPGWEECPVNSDICFDHWPDWTMLVNRMRDDAAAAAALLSEAACSADVFIGGGRDVAVAKDLPSGGSPSSMPRIPSIGHGMEVM